MPTMFCPQCGRELDLDRGQVRFCRYCGFALADTKDALHGYSEQKRTSFAVVTCSYALLLIVTLLLHAKYIPLETGWGYWLSALLIVMSVSFFVSAAVSALKPGLFSKSSQRGRSALEVQQDNPNSLKSAAVHGELPLPGPGLVDLNEQEKVMARVSPPGSVTEGTTKRLDK
jgi:hypothetical protein